MYVHKNMKSFQSHKGLMAGRWSLFMYPQEIPAYGE